MLASYGGFRAFTDYILSENIQIWLERIRGEIEADSSVVSVDEEQYINKHIEGGLVSPLTLVTSSISVSQKEVQVPGRYFPYGYDVESHQSFPKPVITFHVPFTGQADLLRCRPSTYIMNSDEIAIDSNVIKFEVINFNNDKNEIEKKRDEILGRITQQIESINKDISAYNSSLPKVVRDSFAISKSKYKAQSDLLDSLGSPRRE